MQGKERFKDVALVSFLLIDLVLILLLFNVRKKYVRLLPIVNECQTKIDQVYNDYIELDESRLRTFLCDINFVEDSGTHFIMLVPPYPCSACLERESVLFGDFLQAKTINGIILAPKFRMKDMKASIPGKDNLKIISYDPQDLSDAYMSNYEQISYFILNNGDIRNIMVTSKFSDIASSRYFNRVSFLN